MNPSSTATTPDQFIAQLEEPRREQVGRLHELIRTQQVLREMIREAAKSPATSAT